MNLRTLKNITTEQFANTRFAERLLTRDRALCKVQHVTSPHHIGSTASSIVADYTATALKLPQYSQPLVNEERC